MGKAKLTKVSVDIKTPFLSVKGDWEADEKEQQAAWELQAERPPRPQRREPPRFSKYTDPTTLG